MTDDLRALLSVLDGPVRPDGEFADALFTELGGAVGPEELSIALDGPEHNAPVLRRRLAPLDPDPRADGEDARRQSGAGSWDGAIAEPAASTSNRSRRRLLAYAAAAVVVVVVVGAVLVRHDTPSRIKIGPAAGAVGGCAGKAYVINQGEGTVSVITMATGVASAPIHVGSLPSALAITPDGKHAYVANKDDGTVSVIRTATGVTSGPLRVGNGPAGVAITPDGKYAYVTNGGDGTVVRITTATMLVSGPLPVGDGPAGVAITPDGKYAYVANSGDGTVSVIRTPTGLSGPGAIDSAAVVSAPIRVGNTPVGVAITPDGKYVYVSNSGDGTVSVITTATGAVSGTIPVGNTPVGVAIRPDGKYVYVSNSGDATVVLIRAPTDLDKPNEIDGIGVLSYPISVGIAPVGVAITPDGKRAYVANSGDGTVSVITTATRAVSATIPAGGNPSAVAICPARSAHKR